MDSEYNGSQEAGGRQHKVSRFVSRPATDSRQHTEKSKGTMNTFAADIG